MADWNIGSVATRIFDLIQDIPTDVSGSLPNIAYMALLEINNLLGESTGSQAIPDNRQSLVTNLTAAKTLSRISQIGVDFDWRLGEFSASKGSGGVDAGQMQSLLSSVNAEISYIRADRTLFSKANG